jgi:hypothetical protein
MSDSDSIRRDPDSSAAAMNVFRALNPDMDADTQGLLENSLNKVDNSLFTLLMTSDWELYETNDKATKTLFEYIQAAWALRNAVADPDTPIQQRAALKVLIRTLHVNLEKEINRFEQREI